MPSGLVWILTGAALIAAAGFALAWIRARARLRLMDGALDVLPVAAQIVAGGRRVVAANAACRSQFEDATIALPALLRRHVQGEVAAAELTRLAQAAEGGRARLAVATSSGETAWREVIAQPLTASAPDVPPGNGARHVLWLCRDVTAERRAEDALRPLVQAFDGPVEGGAPASGPADQQIADSGRFAAQLAQTLRLKAVGQLA